MKRFVAIALALAILSPAVFAQQKYEIQKDIAQKVGWKYTQSGDQTQRQQSKVSVQGQVLQEEDQKTSFAYEVTIEVLEAEGDDWTKAELAFSRATKDDEDVGLAGKTVIAAGKEGERTFECQDGELDATQEAFLQESFNKGEDDKPQPQDLFFPDEAKAVGESWPVDIEQLIKAFEMSPEDVDVAKSSAKVTLAGVTTEEGVEIGEFKLEVDLAVQSLPGQPIPLDEGSMKLSGSIFWPISDQVPTSSAQIQISFTGKGTIQHEGQVLDLEFDVQNQMAEKVRPAK